MAKSTNTKTPKVKKNYNLKQKTTGIAELFVIASIGFMAYVVILGVADPISKALTVPAIVWAALRLVTHFTK